MPDFPTTAPDPTVRNVPIPIKEETVASGSKAGGSSKTDKTSHNNKNKDSEENFYSNDEDNKSFSTGFKIVFFFF